MFEIRNKNNHNICLDSYRAKSHESNSFVMYPQIVLESEIYTLIQYFWKNIIANYFKNFNNVCNVFTKPYNLKQDKTYMYIDK